MIPVRRCITCIPKVSKNFHNRCLSPRCVNCTTQRFVASMHILTFRQPDIAWPSYIKFSFIILNIRENAHSYIFLIFSNVKTRNNSFFNSDVGTNLSISFPLSICCAEFLSGVFLSVRPNTVETKLSGHLVSFSTDADMSFRSSQCLLTASADSSFKIWIFERTKVKDDSIKMESLQYSIQHVIKPIKSF